MAFLSKKRTALLLALYFIGYLLVIPVMIKNITLAINPSATVVNIPVSVFIHFVFLCICIYIAKPVWIDSIYKLKNNKRVFFKNLIKYIILILVVNALLGMFINLFSQSSNSENQISIIRNAKIAPLFIAFLSAFFAPILEETIFRGGVFSCLRKHHSYLFSMLISSFLFGFIHVMNSLFIGNFNDLIYLFLYMGLGMILSKSYEKSNSLLVSIGVHMGNNLVGLLGLFLSL